MTPERNRSKTRRASGRLALFAVVAAVARAGAGGTQLSTAEQNALTTIDQVPTATQLAAAFGSGDPAPALVSIAQDTSTGVGIRLRAIRSLASYCQAPCDVNNPAHQTLVAMLTNPPMATGADTLVLRAAIESLGELRVGDDYAQIQTYLNPPSRDVRATTALALADLCDTRSILALRTRLQLEATAQVQLAISSALRVLGQTPLACSGP